MTAHDAVPELLPLGDGAITIVLGRVVDLAINRRVHRLARAIRRATLPAVTDVVPAYASVAVYYDPLYVDAADMAAALQPLIVAVADDDGDDEAREHTLLVAYDGEDLAEVARRTRQSVAEVVERHSARTYTVFMLGFVPGFAYLGELDPSLELERRAEPRLRVPAGSVAIAGRQTAVYPRVSPGGWHLIGRTDAVLFDAEAVEAPALLTPGDRVRFAAAE